MQKLIPTIDWNHCDGDRQCAIACPNNVIYIKKLDQDELSTLSLMGKIKTKIKGNSKAYIKNPDRCIACGKCVKVCHEHAISFPD